VKRILVPLDGSPFSEAIIPLATALARGHRAELLLVRARRRQGFPEREVAAQEEAETYLTLAVKNLLAPDLPVRWAVCCDEPDRAIARAVLDNEADLVTMSTHGRGGVTPSVAERVVQQVPVPVLLTRGDLVWQRGRIGRVVVPLDGSELAARILPVVARLAEPFDFTIDLLRAIEPLPGAGSLETAAASYLAEVAGQLDTRGLAATYTIACGQAADVVVRHAGGAGVGLIAMSTHGRTGQGRLLLGSVAERVLRAASVPVLLWNVGSGDVRPHRPA
jgi:nucleotide-binding universal stress UspA family protein